MTFLFLRSRSRLALSFLIVVIGAMCHLIGELVRIDPHIRLFGTEFLLGYAAFTVLGTGITSFAIPNLAMDLTVKDPPLSWRCYLTGFALVVTLIMGIGMYGRQPRTIAAGGILDGTAALITAIAVLTRRAIIPDGRVRRMASIFAGLGVFAIPPGILQQVFWSRSPDPFGITAPPYPQIILMFLITLLTLILGSHWIIVQTRILNRELDLDAVSLISHPGNVISYLRSEEGIPMTKSEPGCSFPPVLSKITFTIFTGKQVPTAGSSY